MYTIRFAGTIQLKTYLVIFNLQIFLTGNNTFQILVTDPRFLLTRCVGKDRQVK